MHCALRYRQVIIIGSFKIAIAWRHILSTKLQECLNALVFAGDYVNGSAILCPSLQPFHEEKMT